LQRIISNIGRGKSIAAAMAVDFDANDSNFTSMTQLENYEHAISGAPFSGIMCLDVLEAINQRRRNGQSGARGKDLSMNNYFVYYSSNSIGPTTDQAKFYDVGNFQCALANTQATAAVGELWIEYSFTMIRRKSPESTVALTTAAAHVYSRADDATAASPLGLTAFTSCGISSGSTYGVANMNVASGVSAYQTGRYLGLNDAQDARFNLPNVSGIFAVTLVWNGATAITSAPALTAGGGGSTLSIWGPAGVSAGYPFFLAAGTSACQTVIYQSVYAAVPIGSSNRIDITGLATMTDGNWDLYVCRLPNTLVTMSELVEDECTKRVRQVLKSEKSRMLELEEKMDRLLKITNSSVTDDEDWKCRMKDLTMSERKEFEKSKVREPSGLYKPSGSSVPSSTSLSDSVVDLITAKLRK
jgi:hypothetical protein